MITCKKKEAAASVNHYFDQLNETSEQTSGVFNLPYKRLYGLRDRLHNMVAQSKDKSELEAAINVDLDEMDALISHVKKWMEEDMQVDLINRIENHRIEFDDIVTAQVNELCWMNIGIDNK